MTRQQLEGAVMALERVSLSWTTDDPPMFQVSITSNVVPLLAEYRAQLAAAPPDPQWCINGIPQGVCSDCMNVYPYVSGTCKECKAPIYPADRGAARLWHELDWKLIPPVQPCPPDPRDAALREAREALISGMTTQMKAAIVRIEEVLR